jgi:hypothetical protein
MTDKKKGRPESSPKNTPSTDHKPPVVTGQCAEVLDLLRANDAVLSFHLTADLAIPEAAARIHDLRAMGFNIKTVILPDVEFRGRVRHNVALYSLGVPSWPAPGFLEARAEE